MHNIGGRIYATYTLLPMHELGKISEKGGVLIIRHGRILRILR